MIDLNAMDRDPWPTWPVDKDELRMLVEENEKLRAANDYLCSRVDYLPYCHEIDRLRKVIDDLRHKRNVLQKICAERVAEIDRLRAALLEIVEECRNNPIVIDRMIDRIEETACAALGEKTND